MGTAGGSLEGCGGENAPSDEIGDANAANGRIDALRVGFCHYLPHGGKLSKNVECLMHQREKGDRDADHYRP
jgi:hypothetical protein